MNSEAYDPRDVLNKAFRKVKPNRADFETFKVQLSTLLASVKAGESEEFHKNLIAEFLKKSYYDAGHAINTKARNDLVIHEGKTSDTPVAVILEAKKPGNKSEMPTPTDLNRKALHELVLYYLRERVTNKNLGIKHLVVTNTYEWFIFDAGAFEKTFVEHKAFVKNFEDFEAGRLSGRKTEFFYNTVVKPFIAGLDERIPFTYVDLRDYQTHDYQTHTATESVSEKKLITLYKLFSPEHLLKLPFANDSNTLDKTFYAELLHIIGLTEVKEGGKKLIVRQEASKRGDASILENTIVQLTDRDKLSRLADLHYGSTREERLFNVALELTITWMNRVLFLKLLESQLKSYHNDADMGFLSAKRLHNYDDLNTLFFGVLARPVDERSASVTEFEHVPYLNSSLFELSELEHLTLDMSALRDERELPLYAGTVLKDAQGKRRTGKLNTLTYLFEFLDAYDFSSEGSETVQEERKTLINASVLGLIFEKINGYKDGSFFTPGFITMYMCRETVRRAVVQKFNEVKGWACRDFDELYNQIGGKIDDKREANAIINSLKVCDPAVGSGHFLVSALNELLSIKSELKILQDENGKTLRDYSLEVISDELVITDSDGELFAYNPKSAESQRVQKTLFLEKQTLIESCLFGVDLNPNSVKICRLRLWIELLKHAYYKEGGQLETLPNIDINIKTGNSLVSRFALDADLKQALKKSDTTVKSYQNAVNTYRNATSKEEKREMERLIERIKGSFRTEIANNDPKVIRLENLRVKLATLEQSQLFAETAAQKKEREKLEKDVGTLSAELEVIRSNKIFEHAFEWRFEFPEVLDDNGDFTGFDIILGNPPYIRQETIGSRAKEQLAQTYRTYHGSADLLVYFVELGVNLLRRRGQFSYIIANKWMRADYGKPLRKWLKGQQLLQIVDYGDLPVFEEATTYPCILSVEKAEPTEHDVQVVKMESLEDNLRDYAQMSGYTQPQAELDDNGWSLASEDTQKVLAKLSKVGVPLEQYVDGKIYYGIKTGLNDAFVVDEATKNKLIAEDPKSAEVIKPFLRGRDIKRWQLDLGKQYLLFIPWHFPLHEDKNISGASKEAEAAFQEGYPAIYNHLLKYKEELSKRNKAETSIRYEWYALQRYAASYWQELEKPKIMYLVFQVKPAFAFDTDGSYGNNATWMIPKEDYMLLAILNSKIGWFLISNYCTQIQNGYQLIFKYLGRIPIRTINFSDPADQEKHDAVVRLVETMLTLHEQKAVATDSAELSLLEQEIAAADAQIDRLVYGLYDLTEEEIRIVEGSVK